MNRERGGSVVADMSMRRLVRTVPVLAVALLGTVGCAGDPAPQGAGPGPPVIQDYRFPELIAAPGATVTVVDGDGEPHTVTADDGSFDTGSFDSSAPGTFVAPTAPGSYPFHCTVHPSMRGTLTVR